MTGRFVVVGGALLVLANVALGEGSYQQTRDGKTLVWNNHPKPGDEATWSGSRDNDDSARGFGTLTWYTKESGTASEEPVLYARFWGNMVRGKFDGPVNVHSKRKTNHAIFVDGSRKTRWASGPAPSRAGAQWRALVQRAEDRRERAEDREQLPTPRGYGEPGILEENAQRSTSNVQRSTTEAQPEAPGEGPISTEAGKTESPSSQSTITESSQGFAFNSPPPQPSTLGPQPSDVNESLRLLAWPPSILGMRSMSKGPLAGVVARVNMRLTKREVVDLANAAARSHGYDPAEYQRPVPQYDPSDHAWSLMYEEKPADGTQGKHLSVAVGDRTKRTALAGGR